MAVPGKRFPRVRLVYHRGSALLKSAVLAAIGLSAVALMVISAATRGADKRTAQLQRQAVQLQRQNRELVQQIGALGTTESIKRIATEVLGLVDPDAVFFCPVEPTDPT